MSGIQCASCFQQLCVGGGFQKKNFCPKNVYPEVYVAAEAEYATDAETREMAKNAAIMESRGYIAWPRLKDIIEFAKAMKYARLTVFFCPDLWREAKRACRIFVENGFTVSSRVCRTCRESPLMPDGFIDDIMHTNPDFVINAGLCFAQEAQISKNDIPATTFIARDGALNNYPAAAIYCSDYWKDWAEDVYRKKFGLT